MLGLWVCQETATTTDDAALTWMFLQAISPRILIIIHRPPDKSPLYQWKVVHPCQWILEQAWLQLMHSMRTWKSTLKWTTMKAVLIPNKETGKDLNKKSPSQKSPERARTLLMFMKYLLFDSRLRDWQSTTTLQHYNSLQEAKDLMIAS